MPMQPLTLLYPFLRDIIHIIQADARTYFKAIQTIHKDRKFTKAPDVKRDVRLFPSYLPKSLYFSVAVFWNCII